jgi:hypothetical protein
VRQLHGVWSAVTEDLSARGCRIVSGAMPRPGSLLSLTISSDLFPGVLDTLGEVVWVSSQRFGILFVDQGKHHGKRNGLISPPAWLDKVLEHHSSWEPEDDRYASRLFVPVIGGPRKEAAIDIRSRRRRYC